MDFVHLHVHSHYSLLDGLTQIKPLVKAAKARGFKALALTDYGSLYGVLEFYETCRDEGIKPIIGMEAYVGHGTEKETYHLTLLAEDYEGYKNLMRLSSIAHIDGFVYEKPRLEIDTLAKHHQGIMVLSGCIQGEIPQLIRQGKIPEAKSVASRYKDIFGSAHFYLELQDHPGIHGQMEVNTQLIDMASELAIPLVVTRDVHYLDIEDAEAQDILTCIGKGWKVGDSRREDYRQVDRSLNSAEDITSRFRHVPEALENTVKIAERVNIEIPLNEWHFAPIQLPHGKTAGDVLSEMVYSQVDQFYHPLTPEVKKRIESELEVINNKGYAPYFLCVADYVQYAKDHGIIETTRGSAAGSVVSYVIGITTVDPIRFNIPFERFLNPFRPSPPDIDTDFADDRREEMIEYVTKKYGDDKVAQIITFGTMAARASVRDVGRALGLSYTFCDQVAKLIPMGAQGFLMTILRAIKEEPDLKELYKNNPDVKRLLNLAQKVEGCARHTSIHAAGVVISPTPLTDFTPIQREVGGNRITTQYEMHSVEAGGLLKMDFLGIRNLSILGKAVEIVEKTTGEKIDVYRLPLDDKKTFDMLARGETMGTFQLGGSGMTRWVKELKPTTIDDIMAMVALYRPGPMDVIPEYIRRKHHPEFVEYLDPRMEKYLKPSFGLLVYQDDVLLTAIELAGYDWLDADKFRKAIGKKIPEEMEKQKIKFFQGCRATGNLPEEKIELLWQRIEPFAAYGFNKAHAASYGIVAYQTAYMKAHYPVQYMTAVLQAEAGDSEKVAAIVHECDRMGVEVLPPDVNESFRNFAMVSKPGEPGRIRFGLTAVKNVGEHICEVIFQERKEHGGYKNLEDFLSRVTDKDLNKKSLESLIQAGATDCFGHDRGVLLANSDAMLSFMRLTKERATTNQHSLFSGTTIAVDATVALHDAPEATLEEKLAWEKNLLGLYVSSHPFAYFQERMKEVLTPLSDVDALPRDAWVIVGGIVEDFKKKMTKKGSIMLFGTLNDQSGSLELLVFPKAYEQTHALWKAGELMCVIGKTPREEGDNKLIVEKAYLLSRETLSEVMQQIRQGTMSSPRISESQKYITIMVSPDTLKKVAGQFKSLFELHPGDYEVYVKVGGNTIKAQSAVEWNDSFAAKLDELIGEGKVEVKG